MELLPKRQRFRILIIFLGAEIHFISQGSDQGPVEQSGVNDNGAETQANKPRSEASKDLYV